MRQAAAVDAERIREAARAVVAEHHLPGLAVGVVHGENLVYAEGFGFADIGARRPFRPESRQRIGSLTKTMVGLCVMALAEEGRLSLEDRVADLLPELVLHGDGQALTVWHLLTHTGGVGEAPNPADLAMPFASLVTEGPLARTLTEAYPDGITLEVPPGTKWAYANHGFYLLGEIISRAEGAPAREVIARRVLEPLGMRQSDTLDERRPDLAWGYHHRPRGEEGAAMVRWGFAAEDDAYTDGHNAPARFFRYCFNGAAGCVQSTIPDMALYASALLRKGDGIVSAGTFDRMVTPQWQPDARLPAWGLAFGLRPHFGHRAFGHIGSMVGGWHSFLAVLPDDDTAVLVFTNIMYGRFATSVAPRIVQAVLGAPALDLAARPPDPEVAASAPGVYSVVMPGPLTNFRVLGGTGAVQIMTKDGGLALRSQRGPWKEGVRLVPVDEAQPDVFALDNGDLDPQRVVTVRGPDGAVTGLRFSNLVEMRRSLEVEPW